LSSSAQIATEHFFRHEHGRLVATWVAQFGTWRLQLVEDAVQEALVRALQTWPYRGVPDNPAAWLTQAARNVMLDHLRREQRWQEREDGIAACHSTAQSAEATDWPRIVSLYDQLLHIAPSPIAALNRAIAIGRAQGAKAGLEALNEIHGLDGYHLLHAARGTFAVECGENAAAVAHFREALANVVVPSEREFLERQLRSVESC
jgi:predicted RNA polymerase sigma factor